MSARPAAPRRTMVTYRMRLRLAGSRSSSAPWKAAADAARLFKINPATVSRLLAWERQGAEPARSPGGARRPGKCLLD